MVRLRCDHEWQLVEATFEMQLVATFEQLGWVSEALHAAGVETAAAVEPHYGGESYSAVAGAGDGGDSLSLRENSMTSSDDGDAAADHSSVS